jgi:hypothetical protein
VTRIGWSLRDGCVLPAVIRALVNRVRVRLAVCTQRSPGARKRGRGTPVYGAVRGSHVLLTPSWHHTEGCVGAWQMEEEGVPSTALREISLLQMLSESIYIVRLLKVEHVEENGKPILYLVRLHVVLLPQTTTSRTHDSHPAPIHCECEPRHGTRAALPLSKRRKPPLLLAASHSPVAACRRICKAIVGWEKTAAACRRAGGVPT